SSGPAYGSSQGDAGVGIVGRGERMQLVRERLVHAWIDHEQGTKVAESLHETQGRHVAELRPDQQVVQGKEPAATLSFNVDFGSKPQLLITEGRSVGRPAGGDDFGHGEARPRVPQLGR